MWVVNDIAFNCEPLDILNAVQFEAQHQGRDILRHLKQSDYSIQFTCPWHKNGQERRPSCGLITHKKKDGLSVGTVHCFACNHTTNLFEFVSNCFGIYDGGTYGLEWLKNNFSHSTTDSRNNIDLIINNLCKPKISATKPDITYVSESELDSYRYYHPYMYQRKLTNEVIDLFDIGFDANFNFGAGGITFPVRDITGGTLFVAKRAINSKVFYYPPNSVKPVYGLYELSILKNYPDEIYICESMLDALVFWTHKNKYAVALNGLGTSNQYKQLNEMPCRKFILATDNDLSGFNAKLKLKQNLKHKIIATVDFPNNKKDANDLTYEELENLKDRLF